MDDIEKRLGTETTNGLITVAYASTNDISIPPGGILTAKVGFRYSEKIQVINPQLRIWLEAKRQYAEYISVNDSPRI